MRSVNSRRGNILALAAASLISGSYASAATKYWDLNGTTAGAGTTPTGAFDFSTNNWNTVADGTGAVTTFVNGDTAIFSAGSDATGAFTVTAGGTPTIGGMEVEEGTMTLSGAVAAGNSTVTVDNGATLITGSSSNITFTASGTGHYVLNGGTLRTTNTGSAGNFVASNATITLGPLGGTFDYQVANTLNIIQTGTPGTAISGSGSLTKTGVGVIAIAVPASYSGATIINGGEIRVRTVSNTLPVTTPLTVGASGILNLNNLNQTVGSITGSGLVGTGSGVFTVNGATDTTFSGSIRDVANAGASGVTTTGGKFTKNGTSTLTLTGLSTYTGVTTITNGGLTLANTTGLALGGTSSVAINAATAVVTLGANDQINNAATISLNGGHLATGGFSEGSATTAGVGALTVAAGGGVIDMGRSLSSILSFADSSAATWAGTLSVYNYTGTPLLGGGIDQLYFGTAATLTPTQLADIKFYADGGTLLLGGAAQLPSGEVVVATPEPTSLALLAGLGGLTLARRRRA